MDLFVVDEKKCKKDLICVDECPIGIIELKEGDSCPSPLKEAEEFCITCGHCVAVCPQGALSHREMNPKDCTNIDKKQLISPSQIEQTLCSRRSIRTYKKKTVDKEVIKKLIEIARFAPSGHNTQPVKWLVIQDPEKVKELASLTIDWLCYMLKKEPEFAKAMNMDRAVDKWKQGADSICRGAPHIIFARADKEEKIASQDCTIALSYLEIAAYSFGLGACWAGYLNAAAIFWPPLQKAIKLEDNMGCFGAMMLGFPKYRYYRIPLRNRPTIDWI